MANKEVFGAAPIQSADADVAKTRAQQLRQRVQSKIAQGAQDFKTRPIRSTVGVGVRAAAAGVIIPTAVVAAPALFLAHKGNRMYAKSSDTGRGLVGDSMGNAKNYTKNVLLSPFYSDALSKENATYYSGIKNHQMSNSVRGTVMSWFGLDEEESALDGRDKEKEAQEVKAVLEQKEQEQRMKDDMARRNAGIIPFAISQALRDPAIRNYVSSRKFDTPDDPSAADAFFNNEETATAQRADQRQRDAYQNTNNTRTPNTEAPFQREYQDGSQFAPQSRHGIPSNTTPLMLNADTPSTPLFPVGGQEYMFYAMSPEVMTEYDAMRTRASMISPALRGAIDNGRNQWKGIPDEVMVDDMKTLKEGAYLDYMAGGIEDGSIMDMNEMNQNATSFEKEWASLESNEIDAAYGDRLRAYERSRNFGSKDYIQSLPPENQRDLILQQARLNKGKAARFIDSAKQFGRDIGITSDDVKFVATNFAANGLKSYRQSVSAKNLANVQLPVQQPNVQGLETASMSAIPANVDLSMMKDVSPQEEEEASVQAVPAIEDRSRRALPSFTVLDESVSASDVLNSVRDREKMRQAVLAMESAPAPTPAPEAMSL